MKEFIKRKFPFIFKALKDSYHSSSYYKSKLEHVRLEQKKKQASTSEKRIRYHERCF